MAPIYQYDAARKVIEGPGLPEGGYPAGGAFEAAALSELFMALFTAGATAGQVRRRASEERQARYEATVKATTAENLERRLEAVLRTLANAHTNNTGPMSTASIRRVTKGKNELLIDALHKLEEAGGIERVHKGAKSRGWRITDRGLAADLAGRKPNRFDKARIKTEPIEGPNDYYGRAFSNGAKGAD